MERDDLADENRTLVRGCRSGGERAMVSLEQAGQRIRALSSEPVRHPPQEARLFETEVFKAVQSTLDWKTERVRFERAQHVQAASPPGAVLLPR